VRLHKRAAGLIAGAVILFAVGANVQAGWLYALSGLFLGAVIAGGVLPFAALRGLRADLDGPDEAMQGAEAFVELRLANRARGVRWSVSVTDDHLEQTDVFVSSIRSGERIELSTVRMPKRRGAIRTRDIEVRSAAPFGVAERRRRLAVDASTVVLPRVFPLGDLSFVEPVGTTEAAMHVSPRRGQGPEYLGVREYRTGDSMRHVHWGLTARHNQVMVREFEEERTRRLAIVVDTERDAGTEWTPLDRVCAIAASIGEAANARGHGVRLVAGMAGGDVNVLARAEEREALRWLAALEPSGVPLVEVLGRLGHDELRGVATLVVTFPMWATRDVAPVVSALRESPVMTVVCVPVCLSEGEGRAASLDTLVRELRGAGVTALPWRPNDELADALGAGPVVS
jgi:uncharacterized protein (DUF58 family)